MDNKYARPFSLLSFLKELIFDTGKIKMAGWCPSFTLKKSDKESSHGRKKRFC
jgi:hypothetical protein